MQKGNVRFGNALPNSGKGNWKNFIRDDKKIAAVLVFLFLLQIFPILYLGQYNHPTSDDFLYGKAAHDAWVHTEGSLLPTVQAAVDGVKQDYYRWQGSFSALFFMRLEPTVFGEAYYAVVPYVMLGLLSLSTLYFVRTLCKIILKDESACYISLSMLLLMLCVQFSPVASEQFFWYNSSVYYNAFHSFLLFYLSWIVRYLWTGARRYGVYMAIFSVVLGGGNYISALTLAIILFLALVGAFWKGKAEKLYRLRGLVLLANWLLFMACFAVSALAPGNAVRAESTWGYSPVASILHSLLQGVKYYQAWTDKWWLLVACCMMPVMIGLVKKTKFSFAFPGVVMLLSYGIFSAMSCPTFYALGTTGPGRIINIIYDAFLMISYLQLFYMLGWIFRKWEELWERAGQKDVRASLEMGLERANGVAIGCCILLLLLSGSFLDTTTITACKVWWKGEAKQYDLEYQERLKKLEDESISDVVFAPYSVEPDLVFIADALADPEFVNNREWADFYGKNSLIVRP